MVLEPNLQFQPVSFLTTLIIKAIKTCGYLLLEERMIVSQWGCTAYLYFLFAKGNTVYNEHSRCLIRFRILCEFCFKYSLIFRASGSQVNMVRQDGYPMALTLCADASVELKEGYLPLEVDCHSKCLESGQGRQSLGQKDVDLHEASWVTFRETNKTVENLDFLQWQPSIDKLF